MLKIKDNIDLKELENFGFEVENHGDDSPIYTATLSGSEYLDIDIETREIRLFICDEYYNTYTNPDSFDLLFDLIAKGWVKKC